MIEYGIKGHLPKESLTDQYLWKELLNPSIAGVPQTSGPLDTVVTDVADLLKNKRVEIFVGFLEKVKECLSLSGPWKWKGVSVPHPFFKMGNFDMCLSKSNVDALDVVLNLLYNGVKEIKDLFEKITKKVSDWVSQKLLSKLGFLTIEQQNSLPLVLTQGAKCITGTKDWSIKVKITGKYNSRFRM